VKGRQLRSEWFRQTCIFDDFEFALAPFTKAEIARLRVQARDHIMMNHALYSSQYPDENITKR
jgi:hypothetical protein